MSDSTHSFLVELGTEELPAQTLSAMYQAFAGHIREALDKAGLSYRSIHPYATPRRLALKVSGLPRTTPAQTQTVWGPPAAVAFDGTGTPTRAAEAFASKHAVSVAALKTANDGKVDKLVVEVTSGGEPTQQLLPAMVQSALAALPIARRMRWGASREEFVRPAHWLLMLWDSSVISCRILGLDANNQTWGHRFHCPQPLTVNHADDYETVLQSSGFVIADFEARKRVIREQVIAQAQSAGGDAVIDDDLLDEVTSLVEWPVAMAGRFDEQFLSVPPEALVSSMKEHQKYFHMVGTDGKLLPGFVAVANLESTEPGAVIRGNERVIRPRLADAAFFFDTDKKVPLASHREKLARVVFQAQLGTLLEKTDRVSRLAGTIADYLKYVPSLAERAGFLSKADLATAMVYEFADMQGIAGYYYARHDGESQEVALALKEQYLPRFAGDQLPETATGVVLALADRLDTLAGIFGIGQIPTGSKDPFALRRASLAVLRLLVEKALPLDLRGLLEQAVAGYRSLPRQGETVELALNYMLERFRSWYEEAGIASEVFQAVSARDLTCPLDINHRVYAVAAFARLPEAQALASANKRVSNLLAKQSDPVSDVVQSSLLQEPAEQALAEALAIQQRAVEPLIAANRYTDALASLAQLRAPVDRFFDEVMVMTEDTKLRDNRLALLKSLRSLFLEIADISFLIV